MLQRPALYPALTRRKPIKALLGLVLALALSGLSKPAMPTHVQALQKDTHIPHQKPAVKTATLASAKTAEPVAPQPAPQPAPTPAPGPSAGVPGDCQSYRPLVAKYDWSVEVALAVMRAESGCNPAAIGDRHIPPVSCGLFQVRTLDGRPSCEALQDPATNVEWAHKIFASGGWRHWSVCNNGIVSCY